MSVDTLGVVVGEFHQKLAHNLAIGQAGVHIFALVWFDIIIVEEIKLVNVTRCESTN
jgi:hypothetical protein